MRDGRRWPSLVHRKAVAFKAGAARGAVGVAVLLVGLLVVRAIQAEFSRRLTHLARRRTVTSRRCCSRRMASAAVESGAQQFRVHEIRFFIHLVSSRAERVGSRVRRGPYYAPGEGRSLDPTAATGSG